mgnify:CR=1 FL=1
MITIVKDVVDGRQSWGTAMGCGMKGVGERVRGVESHAVTCCKGGCVLQACAEQTLQS